MLSLCASVFNLICGKRKTPATLWQYIKICLILGQSTNRQKPRCYVVSCTILGQSKGLTVRDTIPIWDKFGGCTVSRWYSQTNLLFHAVKRNGLKRDLLYKDNTCIETGERAGDQSPVPENNKNYFDERPGREPRQNRALARA